MSPPTATTEEDAALWDSVVVPRYSSLFSGPLLDALGERPMGTILDIGCGTGHPTFELLRRLGDSGRVVAVDKDAALVDLARRKALDDAGTRVFFKVADVEELEFGDEVFDAVVGNLVLEQVEDATRAFSEMFRVLVPEGRLVLTRPLDGSFGEILDTFREVALRRDLPSLQGRADEAGARYPITPVLRKRVETAGFADVDVHARTHRLPFENARALFADPLVRNVFLPDWRWIAGFERGAHAYLEEVERTLDVYFGGGPLSLTVVVGVVTATRPS